MRASRSAWSAAVITTLMTSPSLAFDYDAMIAEGSAYPERLMHQLVQENQRFTSQVKKACGTRAAPTPMVDWNFLPTLQQQWRNTVHTWQRLEVFPLGPNTDASIRLNITFWPDRKNLVERKMQGLLAQGEAVDLSQGGIAVQGFAASEYLLFDPQVLQQYTNTRLCPSLIAISEKSAQNSQNLLTRWQESTFLADWHDAALGNERFTSAKQAVGYLLEGIAQGAETLAKDKLGKPFRLDKTGGQTNRYLAENWRSGQSVQNLSLNIESLSQLYFGASETAASPHQLLIHLSFTDEAEQIKRAFAALRLEVSQLEAMGELAFTDAQGREQAEQVQQQLKQLEKSIKQTLPHFALAQRFNSKDGD